MLTPNRFSSRPLRRLLAGWAAVGGLVTGALVATAQTESPVPAHHAPVASPPHKPAGPAVRGPGAQIASRPTWKDLTQQQQVALAPLSATWDGLDDARKRKWLAMAHNYPKLSPTEQIKMQERMTEWTELSAQQRIRARLNFAETKELTPEQKEERWMAYQALSAEEKHALAKGAAKPPHGAAPAVKPVAPSKLAAIPTARPASGAAAVPGHVLGSASAPKVNSHTLLPKKPAVAASAPATKQP